MEMLLFLSVKVFAIESIFAVAKKSKGLFAAFVTT